MKDTRPSSACQAIFLKDNGRNVKEQARYRLSGGTLPWGEFRGVPVGVPATQTLSQFAVPAFHVHCEIIHVHGPSRMPSRRFCNEAKPGDTHRFPRDVSGFAKARLTSNSTCQKAIKNSQK
jgi:hypothetical protein